MSERTLEGVSMEIPIKCTVEDCTNCPLQKEEGETQLDCIELLAAEVQRLRTEREKNPGIWDGAPEWSIHARTTYWRDFNHPMTRGVSTFEGKTYTRELPKTKAREIAEKFANVGNWQLSRIRADIIESAINEALENKK